MHLYFKIGSVCLSVSHDCRYFLAPCDKRKYTGHAHQQAASHASTDSACRHPVWLPFYSHVQHYAHWRHNPQSRSAIVAC